VRDDDPALSQAIRDKREDATWTRSSRGGGQRPLQYPGDRALLFGTARAVTEIRDGELYVWPLDSECLNYADRSLAEATEIPQNKDPRRLPVYGAGGFGSKFSVDKWGTIGAALSKQTGRPVKLMLDRDLELILQATGPALMPRSSRREQGRDAHCH